MKPSGDIYSFQVVSGAIQMGSLLVRIFTQYEAHLRLSGASLFRLLAAALLSGPNPKHQVFSITETVLEHLPVGWYCFGGLWP